MIEVRAGEGNLARAAPARMSVVGRAARTPRLKGSRFSRLPMYADPNWMPKMKSQVKGVREMRKCFRFAVVALLCMAPVVTLADTIPGFGGSAPFIFISEGVVNTGFGLGSSG